MVYFSTYPELKYQKNFKNVGLSMMLYTIGVKTAQWHKFDIYLDTFSGVGHLLIRLRLVGWL